MPSMHEHGAGSAAMNGAHILVVDDEPAMRRTLGGFLRRLGYRVAEAASGHEALQQMERLVFDLVILDLRMPGMDGAEVLQAARSIAPDTIFVILTAYGTLDSAIVGIRNGAYDYLLKPTPVQAIARVVESGLAARRRRLSGEEPVALLERALAQLKGDDPAPPARPAGERFMQGPGLTVDTSKQLVVVRGEPVHLTPTEFPLLVYLMRHQRRVVSCRELVAEVQGVELDERDARVVLRTHIHRLRQKVEVDPSNPRLICTVRGRGYTFLDEK